MIYWMHLDKKNINSRYSYYIVVRYNKSHEIYLIQCDLVWSGLIQFDPIDLIWLKKRGEQT